MQLSGQTEEKRAALAGLRRINPDITIATLRMGDVNISPLFRKAEERLYAALKEAGMAEGDGAAFGNLRKPARDAGRPAQVTRRFGLAGVKRAG